MKQKCPVYFINKYGMKNWVIDLVFGARGTIIKFTVDVFHRFGLLLQP